MMSHIDGDAQTIPMRIKHPNSPLPQATRNRVKTATPMRCLIENTNTFNELRYAHCMKRSTKSSVLNSLEYYWHMKKYTLNVDTRYNIMRLGSKFQALFDKNPARWLLVPEAHILDAYIATEGKRANFPVLQNGSFKYRLVATRKMIPVPIHRQSDPVQSQIPPSATAFTHIAYPYHELEVTSHVHPRFVICHTGLALNTMGLAATQDIFEVYPYLKSVLVKVAIIYDGWTCKVPKEAPASYCGDDDKDEDDDDGKEDEEGNDDEDSGVAPAQSTTSMRTPPRRVFRPTKRLRKDDEDEDDSDYGDSDVAPTQSTTSLHTPPRRLLSQTKRLRRNQKRSPKPSRGTKRKAVNGDLWLDEATLNKLNKEVPTREAWRRKKKSIIGWVNDVKPIKPTTEEGGEGTTAMDEEGLPML